MEQDKVIFTYVELLRKGKITQEQIPSNILEQVLEKLTQQ